MAPYERQILHKLLDVYENSKAFKGENKVNRRIRFVVSPNVLPAYFDESSSEYETVHEAVKELERLGFAESVWKKGGVLQEVVLNTERLEEAYDYVGRESKRNLTDRAIAALSRYREQLERQEGRERPERQERTDTPVCRALLAYLTDRLEADKPVKEYLDLKDLPAFDRLIRAVYAVETNDKPCYVREFSIRVFHDSKGFEQIKGKVLRVFRDFCEAYRNREEKDILAEYGIYHTPDYVYLKGRAKLRLAGELLELDALRQGIGISGDDLDSLSVESCPKVRCVMTIENLTTFFRWKEKNALIVYLGGYHNTVRRRLLQEIYRIFPNAEYRHFGDIDAGGFEIYRDLREKTGIPFEMYRMDLETLKQYRTYAGTLTKNDRARLLKMAEALDGKSVGDQEAAQLVKLIQYMLAENIKLEQECIAP